MASTSIYLENVTKTYRETLLERDVGSKALNNISLEIKNGETMSILGPSGCGKTTLLKVIAGLESIQEGAVYYNGKNVTDMPPKDRGIGMVFQGYALYPNYKSKGNLSFYFWVRKAPQDRINQRVKQTSRIMGMGFDKLLGRMPTTLSGGEQQRVAIARCIVRYPTIFLMDEPISNLDAKLRVKTRGEIKRLLMDFAITTVYVTHDQIEAIAMGDRIAVMREGKIVQVGTYHDIYEHPINRFVADFVGSPPMNFFEGELFEGNRFKTSTFSLALPSEKLSKLNGRRQIYLGIRPENINLKQSPFSNKKNTVLAKVKMVESLGMRTIIYLSPAKSKYDTFISVLGRESTKPRKGEKIEAVFNLNKMYAFDKDTEKAII